jgi:hypothetical protein
MRGQYTFTDAGLHTLIDENGRGNSKKILTNGIIKNTGTSGFVIYVQWTEERDANGDIVDVTASNGFPVESGETVAFDLIARTGTRVKAPVQVYANGAGSIRYVFE